MTGTDKIMTNRRALLLGLGATVVMPSKWSLPIIKSVVTPVHAQASVCPMIITLSDESGAESGLDPRCFLSFDVLSGDPMVNLSITNITNSELVGNATVEYDGEEEFMGPVEASNLVGPRVVWRGDNEGGPLDCLSLVPVDDVTFSITATCDAAEGIGTEEFTQEFTLTEIIG